ncbi:hypothetical protein LQ318_05655 [Aliifodinibius salicampi]|uniref:Uncharacterized protein n=1 Tax=Fodinibius salicampi TaxID=1920655 RepID=A0ABT3PX08_9BACT|nr:hypothetical protein [Fodinibius salicampi]MCW9712388.1 hypothetical protein [Fodinibius salicampi]
MRRFILILPVILIVGLMNIQAQPTAKNYQNNAGDSLKISGDVDRSSLDQMPIYNPKDSDAKILHYKPKGFTYDMPVIGQADSLSSNKEFSLDLGKNLFDQWPSNIKEDQEEDSTENKKVGSRY